MGEKIRHFVLETKDLGTFDVVEYKEYQELQKRIDKAIEYIDRRDIEWGSEEHNKLLSILKGEDKEWIS